MTDSLNDSAFNESIEKSFMNETGHVQLFILPNTRSTNKEKNEKKGLDDYIRNIKFENDPAAIFKYFQELELKRKFVIFDEILPVYVVHLKKNNCIYLENPTLSFQINSTKLYSSNAELKEIRNINDNQKDTITIYKVLNLKDIFQHFVYKNNMVMNNGRNNKISITLSYIERSHNGHDDTAGNSASETYNSGFITSFEPLSPFVNMENSANNTTNSTDTLLAKKNHTFKNFPIYSVLNFRLRNVSLMRLKKIISSLDLQPSKTLVYLREKYGGGGDTSNLYLKIIDISYFLINDSFLQLDPMINTDDDVNSIINPNESIFLTTDKSFTVNYDLPFQTSNQIKISIRYLVNYCDTEYIEIETVWETQVNVNKSILSPLVPQNLPQSSNNFSSTNNIITNDVETSLSGVDNTTSNANKGGTLVNTAGNTLAASNTTTTSTSTTTTTTTTTTNNNNNSNNNATNNKNSIVNSPTLNVNSNDKAINSLTQIVNSISKNNNNNGTNSTNSLTQFGLVNSTPMLNGTKSFKPMISNNSSSSNNSPYIIRNVNNWGNILSNQGSSIQVRAHGLYNNEAVYCKLGQTFKIKLQIQTIDNNLNNNNNNNNNYENTGIIEDVVLLNNSSGTTTNGTGNNSMNANNRNRSNSTPNRRNYGGNNASKTKLKNISNDTNKNLCGIVVYQTLNIPGNTCNMNNGASDYLSVFNTNNSTVANTRVTSGINTPNAPFSLSSSELNSTYSGTQQQQPSLSAMYWSWKKRLAQLPYQNGVILLNNDYKIPMEDLENKTIEFDLELIGLQRGYYPSLNGLKLVDLSSGEVIEFGSKLAVMVE
ncbi:uncharacterized protein SCODWIG_03130 [Saccharomycodes ludwigii]|uniref:Trafficking protein particle complex II-specific subunit 65 IgD2 domain-containing protein n=1 Tax=Saccharomycodes ludwigii TaxID=36035 RepID=A0A376B9W7_9ASCO|nr:uncharacterized protein SCODWIG_03130 [Saccharomycodes ludwigii]